MDIQMPHMDGITATRLIRADHHRHQPRIVAITASARVEDRDACLAAGMDGYLSKPMRAREVEQILGDIRADRRRPASMPSAAAGPGRSEPDNSSPAVDVAVFDDLIAQLDNSGGTLREELIAAYLADTSVLLDTLITASRDGDSAAAADIAHTMRSSSTLIGSQLLAELLQRTATAARTQPADLPSLTQLVMIEYARVTEALHEMHLDFPVSLRSEAAPRTPPLDAPN
jgi:CheY-like chemotaxis protein